jgi:hypothetical protein
VEVGFWWPHIQFGQSYVGVSYMVVVVILKIFNFSKAQGQDSLTMEQMH